jgi:hypothetical protein
MGLGATFSPTPRKNNFLYAVGNSWSSGFNFLVLEALTISPGNTPVLVTCHFYNSVKELTGIIMGNDKYLLEGLCVHPYYTMLQSKSPTIVCF